MELSTSQLARFIGKTERTVQMQIEKGQIKVSRIAPGRYEIAPEDLQELINRDPVQYELARLRADLENLRMVVAGQELAIRELQQATRPNPPEPDQGEPPIQEVRKRIEAGKQNAIVGLDQSIVQESWLILVARTKLPRPHVSLARLAERLGRSVQEIQEVVRAHRLLHYGVRGAGGSIERYATHEQEQAIMNALK